MQDGDLELIAYYLQKGHSLESLLALSGLEKEFFRQSMIWYAEIFNTVTGENYG